MPSHRAYINCMRCYELSNEISQYDSQYYGNDKLVQIKLKELRHQARNEVLKVFENKCPTPTDEYRKNNERNAYLYLKEESIDACITCDFSKPSLAIFLKENDVDIKKALADEPQEKSHNYRTNAKPE